MTEHPEGPEDGHTWRINVESRSSHGSPTAGHRDVGAFEPLPNTVEVRAWNLYEALHKAAELPLTAWFGEGEVE